MEDSNLYVDVHHHYNPLSLLSLGTSIKQKIRVGNVRERDIAQTLEMMEKYGIRKSILSFPANFPSLSEKEQADLCAGVNECYAELTRKQPGLGAFALLPIDRNRDLALQEVRHALDTLHLDGVLLPTCTAGIYPGNAIYDDLYQELNRRKATIFLHPVYGCKEEMRMKDMTVLLAEVTRAVCELVFNKIVFRYPHIRFIVSYGGGNISVFFQKNRLNNSRMEELPGSAADPDIPYGIKHDLRKIYYDTAVPVNFMENLMDFADRTRILYGSDFPFFSPVTIRQNFDNLNRYTYENRRTMADYCRENSCCYD